MAHFLFPNYAAGMGFTTFTVHVWLGLAFHKFMVLNNEKFGEYN